MKRHLMTCRHNTPHTIIGLTVLYVYIFDEFYFNCNTSFRRMTQELIIIRDTSFKRRPHQPN